MCTPPLLLCESKLCLHLIKYSLKILRTMLKQVSIFLVHLRLLPSQKPHTVKIESIITDSVDGGRLSTVVFDIIDAHGLHHSTRYIAPRELLTSKVLLEQSELDTIFRQHHKVPSQLMISVETLRSYVKHFGYALTEHGSRERDVDLVAVPWVDTAIGNYALLEGVCKTFDLEQIELTRKPHGRYAAILRHKSGRYKDLDLSIMPLIKKESE